MRSIGSALLLFTLVLAAPSSAEAAVVRYHSAHPWGRGYCYIDMVHVHDHAPADVRFYRQGPEGYYFVGDPTPFQYEGPRYAYYSAHPVVEVHWGEPVYCYLDGPHYHTYQPPPSSHFELRAGAYWYTGSFEASFARDRPRYVVINDAYRPMPYARPVVPASAAPPGFRGVIVAQSGGRRGRPAVSGSVSVGTPNVSVTLGFGGAPPPPPPPPQVVVVERHHVHHAHCGHTVHVVDHGHHDNGRHKGWYKHKHKKHRH